MKQNYILEAIAHMIYLISFQKQLMHLNNKTQIGLKYSYVGTLVLNSVCIYVTPSR